MFRDYIRKVTSMQNLWKAKLYENNINNRIIYNTIYFPFS